MSKYGEWGSAAWRSKAILFITDTAHKMGKKTYVGSNLYLKTDEELSQLCYRARNQIRNFEKSTKSTKSKSTKSTKNKSQYDKKSNKIKIKDGVLYY